MYLWGQVLALFALVSSAHARTQLVVFGDSLTDNGNAYNLTSGRVPASPNYWKGRFSNGPNWVDHLAAALPQVDISNFAYGGATACLYPSWPMLTLQTEYALYRIKNSNRQFAAQLASGDRVAVIWLGHNDLIMLANIFANAGVSGAIDAAQRVGSCISNATHLLMADGFKSVVIGTVSTMTYSPFAVKNQTTGLATVAITAVNAMLRTAVASLSARYNGSVQLWDAGTDSVRWFTSWQAEGFKYNGSCITYESGEGIIAGARPVAVCPDPSEWLFHDPVHFSSKLHAIVAQSILNRLITLGIVPPTPPSPPFVPPEPPLEKASATHALPPPHPKPPASWANQPKPPAWTRKPKSPPRPKPPSIVVITHKRRPPSPKRKSPIKPSSRNPPPPRPKPAAGRKPPPPPQQ